MRLATSDIGGGGRRHWGVPLSACENSFSAIGPIITGWRPDCSVSVSPDHGVVAGEGVSVRRHFRRSERVKFLASSLALGKATAYMKRNTATKIRQCKRGLPIASIHRPE